MASKPPHGGSGGSTPELVELSVHPDRLLDPEALWREAKRKLGSQRTRGLGPESLQIYRRSIDARRGRVRIKLRVGLEPSPRPVSEPQLPQVESAPEVAIIGAGPAGLFCAYTLVQLGLRPLVFDRGKAVRERRRDLASLSQRGELHPDSNYCFGEGGAGTFSDGKLYTRASKRGPVREILELLVAHGATEKILVDARPHIGTNKLPRVLTALRERLEAAGARFFFNARVESLGLEDGRARAVILAGGERHRCAAVVLAPGHSAPELMKGLFRQGVAMESKEFAMGVRVEHPQAWLDRIQYGELAGHPALGSAAYRVVERGASGNAYSFCMCPGGHIVPASTQPGRQVVNGMSPAHRRGRYANSGFVTPIPARPDAAWLDIARDAWEWAPDNPMEEPGSVFFGLSLQSALEAAAFKAGGGAFRAPAQRLDELAADRAPDNQALPRCSYHRGLSAIRLSTLLGPLADPIREGLISLEERMPGFAGPEAIALGVESRTSSPIRVLRDPERLVSPSTPGLFPVGEGCGFAGGIVSAAIDGVRAAHAVLADGLGDSSRYGAGRSD